MDDIQGARPLVYKSDQIYERRRRVLREARRIIAEKGVADFTVRELCERAGVAQKTLYNAFGGKEAVVALAVRQYFTDFSARAHYRFEPGSLEGLLEVLIKVNSRNAQIRPYTKALMGIYHSATAEPALRRLLHEIGRHTFQAFVEGLARRRQLRSELTAEHVLSLLLVQTNGVLSDWCVGDLPEEALVDRVSEAALMVVGQSTSGKVRLEADRWLEDVRRQRPSWRAMRKLAEVAPAELRETDAFLAAQHP